MNQYDFDLFVIGAGSGGVRAARMSAAFGARVAVAEERYLGGTCVNVGCVPKKLFVYASQFSSEFNNSAGYGWSVNDTSFAWKHLITQKNQEIERLNNVYEKILANAGVTLFDGHATIVDQHTIKIAERQFTAKHILVATGGWPTVPDFPGNDLVITSNQAFFLETLPDSIVIVGGGYIAVEFAGIFNGLGVATTLVYRGELFLRGFDEDVRQHLVRQLEQKGIKLLFETSISSIEKSNTGLIAKLDSDETLSAEQVMYATGRTPKSAGLGLENLGVELDQQGAIIVNAHYQTSVKSIYAIGDVTNRVNLTPVALAEGMFLAKNLYGKTASEVDYSNIPTCVFSQPNIGTVGLTELQAKKQFNDISIYKSIFKPMKYSLTDNQEQILMKLIVDTPTDRVVGVHMVGADAGEIIQGLAIAMKAGATKAVFDATIGIHPTSAEEFVTMREASS
ncbi:MAG: glutathione-disulfide reductase [Methylococcales bacterium]